MRIEEKLAMMERVLREMGVAGGQAIGLLEALVNRGTLPKHCMKQAEEILEAYNAAKAKYERVRLEAAEIEL